MALTGSKKLPRKASTVGLPSKGACWGAAKALPAAATGAGKRSYIPTGESGAGITSHVFVLSPALSCTRARRSHALCSLCNSTQDSLQRVTLAGSCCIDRDRRRKYSSKECQGCALLQYLRWHGEQALRGLHGWHGRWLASSGDALSPGEG